MEIDEVQERNKAWNIVYVDVAKYPSCDLHVMLMTIEQELKDRGEIGTVSSTPAV